MLKVGDNLYYRFGSRENGWKVNDGYTKVTRVSGHLFFTEISGLIKIPIKKMYKQQESDWIWSFWVSKEDRVKASEVQGIRDRLKKIDWDNVSDENIRAIKKILLV